MTAPTEPPAPDYTASFVITSTGDGTGVTTFRVVVSNDVVFTLDGNGRFYSDASGTADESTTWTATAGATRIRYIKCSSGSSNLIFDDGRRVTGWGDTSPVLGYATATGSPTLTSGVGLSKLTSLITLFIGASGGSTPGDISNLTSLTYLRVVTGSSILTGSISNLTSLTFLRLQASHTLSGDFGVNNVADGINGWFDFIGGNMVDYTAGATWENVNINISPDAGYGLSSTEIDNMLIDMAASQTLSGKTITLQGSNAARTSASDTAYGILTTTDSGYTHVANTVNLN